MANSKTQTANAQPVIRVVKKQPYPFPGSLDVNGVKKPVQVVYISLKGFIANMGVHMVFVGEYCQAILELPQAEEYITVPVRVIKTYDKSLDVKEHKVDRMAEFHFQKLLESQKTAIQKFMTAIRQAK